MKRLAPSLLFLSCLFLLSSCSRTTPPAVAPPPVGDKLEIRGLHNVYRITDKLLSGSGPDGDESFQALQTLGVRTILSVDGARPDVDRARKYGLRYVHLPIGYDGIARTQALALARAVRDLPGPIYLHCHHGKHRGPAAAAVIRLCLDETCTVAEAVHVMQQAGTDPRYTGLYRAPRELLRPTTDELARAAADFPEIATVPALAQLMVVIDERWEHLKRIRAAGWKAPAEHPDLDPAHEAIQLAEHYQESARLETLQDRPPELKRWLADAAGTARKLEENLRGVQKGQTETTTVEAIYRQAAAECARCHARYRDVPQP